MTPEERIRKEILDGGKALEDIAGTDGLRFIHQTLKRLEVEVMEAAFDDPEANMAYFRGVKAGVSAVRGALSQAHGQLAEIAEQAEDEEDLARLGIRFGEGDIST
jgi:hypothetical protein